MADNPNILILMSDQHHPHIMGCEGDPVVRTPNLDRLAMSGTLFENCYCPAPLCVPSRMSFMTSKLPSDNEVWTNSCMLSSDIPTFAHSLGAAGYETVLSGRMHFIGPDQRHGFEKHLLGTMGCGYIGGRNRSMPPELLSATGQNRRAVEVAGPGRTGYQFFDEKVAEACVDFLEAYAKRQERPFCLVAGFVLPHCPFVCPRDDFYYYRDRVTLPEVPEGYFEALHPAVKLWRKNRGIEDLTEDDILRARAGYYGLVTHFDRQVGRVLDALQQSGLAEDTLVIYTSDHGEMAGEHGMWWKSNFYEGSASVPLVISWPGRFASGEKLGQIVNLVDIGPTMIDLAGAGPLPEVAGRSLAPLLWGEEIEWENETFSEHCSSWGPLPARMIRRGDWKLVHYEGYRPQLFDLREDPDELHDLGDDPLYDDIRRDLARRVLADWSGMHVVEVLERRKQTNSLLARWFRTVRPECPEQWVAPPEANVFPDDGEPS